MQQILFIPSQITFLFIIGTIAFLLTALHVCVGLPFFFQIIIKLKQPSRSLGIVFFSSGLLMYLSWLSYVWHFQNLFIRIALTLLIISHIIFLLQYFIHPNMFNPPNSKNL